MEEKDKVIDVECETKYNPGNESDKKEENKRNDNHNSVGWTTREVVYFLIGFFAPLVISLVVYFFVAKPDDLELKRIRSNGKPESSRIITAIIVHLIISAIICLICIIVAASLTTSAVRYL